VRRTANAHVHFLRSGLTQVHYARPRGCATHDRVIQNHDAFSGHHFLDQVQFHAHVEIADQLAWLQECAAYVVVAYERMGVRNL